MDFYDTLSEYLSPEMVSSLRESEAKKGLKGVLLNHHKLSDAVFLEKFPKLLPHPHVPHAYLYDAEEYELGKSYLYEGGAISIEDPAAMLPFYFLKPEKDDLILDMCAAPGGKSIGLSLSSDMESTIVSNDISYARAKRLSSNIERMGLGNVVVTSGDFSICHENFKERFDKILLDAPCSGSAMFRKNPLAKEDWSLQKVLSLAKKQYELLEVAFDMLKPGGKLMYSTCSFSNQEDDELLLSFLANHPDARPIELPDHPGFYHHHSLPHGIHLFPHLYPGEGQYLCLLGKNGESEKGFPSNRSERKYQSFLSEYGLDSRDNRVINGALYSLNHAVDTTGLSLLRYGLKCLEEGPHPLPDHHLSHYLGNESSIPLSAKQAEAYLTGESFKIEGGNGIHILSYEGLNLGFGKTVDGVLKNHYPKGLRKKMEIE